MGLTIDRERFDPQDYRPFERRLDDCLTALERLLERPGFGTGPASVRAELELSLVDGQGRPLPRNQEVRTERADPRVVLEIDRFNLELNLTPAPLAGRPFAAMASELDQARSRSGSGSPGPTRWSWTPTTSAWRGPTPPSRSTCGRLSRVAFGTGWVKGGPLELLEESVRMHEPVLPVVGPEPPLERLGDGGVPALDELRLHQGMVWRWNRAIYDPAGGGHLRSSCGPCPRARP